MVNQQSDIELKAVILEKLQTLLTELKAPDDFKCFFAGLDTLQDLLRLQSIGADASQGMQIAKKKALIDYARSHEVDIVRLFPKSDRKDGKSFHNYIEVYPYFSIYVRADRESTYYPQWLALLATSLPRLIEMEYLRISNPINHENDALMFCRAIRQLLEPKYSTNLEILKLLPSRPATVPAFVWILNMVCKRYKYTLEIDGQFRQFYFIRMMLERDPNQKIKLVRAQNVRKRGIAVTTTPQAFTQIESSGLDVVYDSFIEEGISEFKLNQYFEPRTEELIRLELFDRNLESERIQVNTNLTPSPELIDHYYLENRHPQARKRARFASQAMEMSNQNLPFSRSYLSGFEIDCFLATLDEIVRDIHSAVYLPPDKPTFWRRNFASFAGCVFYLSQAPEAVVAMRESSGGSLTNCLAWERKSQRVFIPVSNPDHGPPPNSTATISVVDHLELLIPLQLSFLLLCHDVKKQEKRTDHSILFSEQYVAYFNELLIYINKKHHTDLTTQKIQMALVNEMAQRAPADKVISIYFRGKSANDYNPAVYSAIPHTRFQKLYEDSIAALHCKAELKPEFEQAVQASFLEEFDTQFVGSLHVPTRSYVKEMLHSVCSNYIDSRSSPGRTIATMHNTYCAWIILFYLATSGVRSVSNVMPTKFDIDFETSTAFVSDKDNAQYFHARLVWLCPELLEQFRLYQEHLTLLRHVLAVEGGAALDKLRATDEPVKLSRARSADRVADASALKEGAPYFFFLDEHTNEVRDTTPTLLATYVTADWELRLVSLRHFMRSNLIEAGCSGEVINALMGHHARGESPWGPYSTLPPVVWREKLSAALSPLIQTLGLQALDGPFSGGLIQ